MRPAARVSLGACLMMTVATLVPGFAAAAAQDDAGLGRDAPDYSWRAALIPGAGFTGMLDPFIGDRADWYVVEAGPETLVRFVLEHDGSANFDLDIPGAGGGQPGPPPPIEDRFRMDWGSGEERIVRSTIGHVVFGVQGWGGGSYRLDIQLRDFCDLRVDEVTEHSDDPTGRQRVVEVTVTNQGPGACIHAGLGVQVEHRDPTSGGNGPAQSWWRDLGGAPLTQGDEFPAGTARRATVAWDSLGEVGDGTLHVGVGSATEGWWEDNQASLDFTLGPAPLGVGADLLNRGVATCDPIGLCARFGVEHNAWRSGWVADWNSQRVPSGHQHIGTHPGGLIHADVDLWDPLLGLDTDIGTWDGGGPYGRACLNGPYGGGCFNWPANMGPG